MDQVLEALFELDAGDTSDVIDGLGGGLHVVKVLERQESVLPKDFDEVKPRVIAYMMEQLRSVMYEQMKGQFDVRLAAGGLREWTTVGVVNAPKPAPAIATEAAADPAAPTIGAAPSPDAADEPDLSALRGLVSPAQTPSARPVIPGRRRAFVDPPPPVIPGR